MITNIIKFRLMLESFKTDLGEFLSKMHILYSKSIYI